jgi:streptogramin lyase
MSRRTASPKPQQTKWIRPTMTDGSDGREPRLRTIPYRRSSGVFLLPPGGAKVPWDATPEGHFWKRRKAGGEVEEFEPAQVHADHTPAPSPFKTRKPAPQVNDHG